MDKKQIGEMGESHAARTLQSEGYTIRDRNWQVLEGELDLIAERDGIVVFVEVRTRATGSLVTPEETFTLAKQRRVIRAAMSYLEAQELLDSDWRVDMIALEYTPGGRISRYEHYENVIQGNPEDFL